MIHSKHTRISSANKKSSKYNKALFFLLCFALIFSTAGCAGINKFNFSQSEAAATAVSSDTGLTGTDNITDSTGEVPLESDYFAVKELALYKGDPGDIIYVKSVSPIGDKLTVLVQVIPASLQETLTGGKNENPPGKTVVKNILLIYNSTGSQISQIDMGAKMDVQSTVQCTAVNESGNPVCISQ